MEVQIGPEDVQYVMELVGTICSQVGPGIAGSPQEHERAAFIRRELISQLGPDQVEVEEFDLAPGAFLGAQLISTLFMLIAALVNLALGRWPVAVPWLPAMIGFVLAIASSLLFVLEFVLVQEIVDPLFTRRHSVNVIGKLRPPETQEIEQVLMLSGHHDSAVEFNWLRFTGYGYFLLTATWLLALITVGVLDGIQLTGFITGNTDLIRIGTLPWFLIVYPIGPALVFAAFFQGNRKGGGTVPGAVDNLAACAVGAAMCRFLVNHPDCIPAGTEIRFLSFGGEEAGVRGSRRYVKRHLEELKERNARLLNIEMIAYPETTILTSETNGTVNTSPELVQSAIAAAERAGVPYRVAPATLGTSNDAGPFCRAGIEATTLLPFKFPQQTVAFYHQRLDRPEALTPEPIFNVMKLVLEWIRLDGGPSKNPSRMNGSDL